MIIENTTENYDILLKYHNLIRKFYKHLKETDKRITSLVCKYNNIVKPGYKLTNLDMHCMLSGAKFHVEDHKSYNDEMLITSYIKKNDAVYDCFQNYMTNSGKVEYLKLLDTTNGAK